MPAEEIRLVARGVYVVRLKRRLSIAAANHHALPLDRDCLKRSLLRRNGLRRRYLNLGRGNHLSFGTLSAKEATVP